MPHDHKSYDPKPIDTTQVKLPAHLRDLTELLASNTHDIWARQRIKEGWTYGQTRDDALKTHPDLVPYAELSESEKQYDRNSATETLKVILSMGYPIHPAPREGGGAGGGLEAPEDCRQQAQDLRRAGELLAAYDRLQSDLRHWPHDARLRQLMGLVLADLGATARANECLARLAREGHHDPETLSILARTHKDLWRQAVTAPERERHRMAAQRYYTQAFEETGDYYPGINVATLAAVAGQRDLARAVAAKVRDICDTRLAAPETNPGKRYYLVATLAEAHLVPGELAAAEDQYTEVAALGRGRWEDIDNKFTKPLVMSAHSTYGIKVGYGTT